MVEGEVEGLRKQGAPEGHEGHNQYTAKVDNINISKEGQQGGTSATYLLKRLKRDAPEAAEAYIQGEYKSVRAAAIAAGIVKVPTEFERIAKALPKLSRHELIDLQSRIEMAINSKQ